VQSHGVALYIHACHTLVGVHVVVVHIFTKLGVVAHVFAGGVGVLLLLFHVRFVCHLSSVISVRANICPVEVWFSM